MLTDVTGQHAAEEATRATELRLQETLNRADCLLWQARVVRGEGGRLLWTVNFAESELQARVFGPHKPAFGADVFADVEVPEAEEIHARSAGAIKGGAAGYAQEYRVIREGRTTWLSEKVSITPAGPDTWDLVGVGVDVTARHEAEQARRTTEAQLEQVLKRADCLVWQASASTGPDATLQWGVPYLAPSILGQRLFGDEAQAPALIRDERRVPRLKEIEQRALAALQAGEPGYEHEFEFLSEHQSYWLYETVSITADGPGRWLFAGVVTDMTARRHAELALAAEKERLKVTLQAMDEAVLTVNGRGLVQFMNRAAEQLTGWTAEAAIAHPLEEVCPVVQSDNERSWTWPLAEVRFVGAPVDLPTTILLRRPAGAILPIEGCVSPVRNARGETIGSVVVFRDVSVRHRLVEQVQRASKLESVGILAGGIAHDFNNILTAIMGNVSVAVLDAHEPASVEHHLAEAERACIRAKDLTQQLLTFAKGGAPIRSALRLPGIIRECAQFALHGSRACCDYELPEDLWLANADRGQVGQIVQNLVINAGQAMPTGGLIRITAGNETITTRGAQPLSPGDYVHLTVRDQGPGIAPEELSKVFDPYFTTKKQGSGLGLASVYSIAHRHRGHVSVESTLGEGATFHVWLPALRDIGAAPDVERAQARPQFSGRVLVMDDEEPVRFAAAKLAQRLGLEADTAADGVEAVGRCREQLHAGAPFDLVIMDLTVPGGMGGAEALQQIRALDPRIRAIVSSGYSSDPVMSDYESYGFDGVVTKPYGLDELSQVLRVVLHRPRP